MASFVPPFEQQTNIQNLKLFRKYDLTDFFRLLQSSGTSFGSNEASGTGIGRRRFHKKFIENGKLGRLNNELDARKGKIRFDHLQ